MTLSSNALLETGNLKPETSFGMPTLIELPDLESHAALAQELGLDFIEINMSFPQYQPEKLDVEKLKEIKEKYGVYFTVHADESTDVCSVNPRIAKAYSDTMLDTIALAKKLGIPTINLHLLRGIYVTLPDRRTFVYAENEDFYLAKLREFRDRAEGAIGKSGIKICIENTDGYDLPFLVHALDTLLESPAFALTFDIGHDNAIKNIDKPVILAREERLRHIHMHDGQGKRVHLALGDGDMDIAWYLALAEKHRCRVVLETKTVAALRQSVKYLREL